MVGLAALWLPILVSAVLVFVVSSIVHMVLRYHWTDWAAVPGEERVRDALRNQKIAPGDYSFPRPKTQTELADPAMIEKFKQGPVGFLTILPSGAPAWGKNLVQWFVYSIVVGIVVAYVTGRTVGAAGDYLQVFRIAGTVAFVAYAGAEPIESIWKGRKWSTTLKNMLDGLLYALVTAGAFGWLYPG